jgi:putative transposase
MHDMKSSTTDTIDRIVIKKPALGKGVQNLCLDKGYDYKNIEYNVVERGYISHIPHRRKKSLSRIRKGHHHQSQHYSRRWVVERTNSWHNRFRKLLVRYEKKSQNYLSLVHLACCIIIYRRIILG